MAFKALFFPDFYESVLAKQIKKNAFLIFPY